VDERHRAVYALERSESRFAHAVWGTSVGFWDVDVGTGAVHWWNDWCATVDLDPCEGADHALRWTAYVHPGDDQPFTQMYQAVIEGRRDIYEAEYRIRTRSGQWRWILSRGRATARDSARRAIHLAGVTIDIDARRRSEQLLQTQATILETMREGVVLVDFNGRIEFTNSAFDRMFDRESDELAGTSVVDLLNLKQKGQSPALAVEGLLDQYNGRNGKRDMLFRRHDGSQFAGEVLSANIQLGGEKRILVVVQDVSERKQLESEIIEIANRERRRLGGDLHDGLGQELTGISLMLRSLTKRAGSAAFHAAPELDEIIALVNHAIQSTRKMALGISPVTLERGGLLSALENLTGWSRDSYGIDVRLRLMLRCPLLIDEAAATHLYLIAQEAINNAVKHGHARSVVVTLRANKTIIYLSITDNGVGIADTQPRGTGMGLKIMEYRATMVGGVVRIERLPNGGTRIRSVCPHVAAAAGFGLHPVR
jgi:PAS domain S-box-containing protein